ncbi:MAG: hypothetical protein CBC49_002055 [Alphaproteobacteria bacterium TMED89]|nr:hypothetical protein [Rhodospirillaceae bacterium]RPH18848.1 MAG: hypothetical protein CBC49_002055 [Alphaproteobacteria bacterium TMED89]
MQPPARWIDKDGKALSCKDKLATLDDNLAELLEIALDALEDAAVMGVDPETARRIFVEEIASLQPRFATSQPEAAGRTSDTPGAVASSTPTES